MLRRPRNTFYVQTLALTSSTSGGRSVGIVRLRTQATEIVLFCRAPQFKGLAASIPAEGPPDSLWIVNLPVSSRTGCCGEASYR
jgi:hypothetical protein